MEPKPTIWSSLSEHWQIARSLRGLRIYFDPEKCDGIWECYQVCPIGCWTPDNKSRVVVHHDTERCIACGACALQCPNDAIELR